jgi:hypothetical protein
MLLYSTAFSFFLLKNWRKLLLLLLNQPTNQVDELLKGGRAVAGHAEGIGQLLLEIGLEESVARGHRRRRGKEVEVLLLLLLLLDVLLLGDQRLKELVDGQHWN